MWLSENAVVMNRIGNRKGLAKFGISDLVSKNREMCPSPTKVLFILAYRWHGLFRGGRRLFRW
jgi:hypothetical protein